MPQQNLLSKSVETTNLINFMSMAEITKADRQRWQAEEDASTMARYQEILGDKARMNRAIKVANKQADDLTKRANALKNVGKTQLSGKKHK